MVADRRDRGQLLLVSAVAIAFIILGVVVIFNGVLYTQTISAGGTTTETRDVATTELEIERTGGCLLNRTDTRDEFESNFSSFDTAYRNLTADSGPTIVNVTVESVEPENGESVHNATLVVEYDSSDVTYEQTLEVEEEDCPVTERTND